MGKKGGSQGTKRGKDRVLKDYDGKYCRGKVRLIPFLGTEKQGPLGGFFHQKTPSPKSFEGENGEGPSKEEGRLGEGRGHGGLNAAGEDDVELKKAKKKKGTQILFGKRNEKVGGH